MFYLMLCILSAISDINLERCVTCYSIESGEQVVDRTFGKTFPVKIVHLVRTAVFSASFYMINS
jgi:hypothetical protein